MKGPSCCGFIEVFWENIAQLLLIHSEIYFYFILIINKFFSELNIYSFLPAY